MCTCVCCVHLLCVLWTCECHQFARNVDVFLATMKAHNVDVFFSNNVDVFLQQCGCFLATMWMFFSNNVDVF